MRFLPYILMLLVPAALAAPKRVWDCQISAKLTGSGQHFMYYGRDAWNGEGSLYCESGPNDIYRKVAVSFNSMFDGFGADRNSNIHMMIDMTTVADPNEMQIRAVVADRNSGNKVQWRFSSELSEAEVYVTGLSPAPAVRSLQRGTIFIRSSGE